MSAHAYELPPDTGPPAEAVDEAAEGEVVYLTRHGVRVAAIVRPEVAAAGAGAIEALEDAQDVADALAVLAEPGEPIPHEKLLAEYADVLAAHPDE